MEKQLSTMTIVDAHSHLWRKQDTTWNGLQIKSLKNGRAIFLGNEVQMMSPFFTDGFNSAEIFLSNMDYAQVAAAVVVQEMIDGIQNDYLKEVHDKYPNRFVTCGMCDFFKPRFLDDAAQLIEQGFKGIAIPGHRLLTDHQRVMLNSDEMMRMFGLMEKNDVFLSVTLADGDLQVGELREVIEQYPRLRVAIGHFGMPTIEGWQQQVLLARHENVMVESGGITWLYNSEFYPFHGAIRAIREAAELVGFDKLMWGSDYPRTITAITYRMSYDFVTKSDQLTEEEKRLFLGENACRFYRLHDLVQLPYIKNMSE